MLSAVISQLVSRFAGIKHNFYDDLLLQDGHELVKIKPPRDLQSWQDLPVSHIMNKKPIIIESTDPKYLHSVISTTPYQFYPFVSNGAINGILTRESIEHALSIGEVPPLSEACIAEAETTVKAAANKFINSPHGFLILVDSSKSKPIGILTLHDLLRAQAAVAE
jgi:CIC family chloride channel protein